MEVVQCSAKNKSLLRNDSGNIVAVIAVIAMIAGAIGFWVSLSGKVDSEVRQLGATQSTTFVRADFLSTIKKSLQGQNTLCPLNATLENKFKRYTATPAEAKLEKVYIDNEMTPANEINDHSEIRCFFNPTRYPGIKWTKVTIKLVRTTEPNYATLSNFIGAEVIAAYKSGKKNSVLKYQLKYRIDVLTISHFGTIFTNTQAGPVVEVDDGKLRFDSNVLFDVAGSRTSKFPLNNIMTLPDYEKVIYMKDTFTSNRGFTANSTTLSFLGSHNLDEVFRKGILYGVLPQEPGFQAPYQVSLPQWQEFLDIYPYTQYSAYPLPSGSPTAAIHNPTTGDLFEYDGTNNYDTNAIYTRSYGNAKKLTKSCSPIADLTSSKYNLYIFNHLNHDFTIDFTQNTTPADPPIFCGVIAAKNLIIKLNGQSEGDAFYKHHVLGKFIISGKVKVIGSGELYLHDLMEYTDGQIEYTGMGIDIHNIRTQLYNMKYYSAQNFFLPFFKTGQTPSVSSLMTSPDRFFVPRGTRAFFPSPCPSLSTHRCRYDTIDSPTMEYLPHTYWDKLLYEVFSVE